MKFPTIVAIYMYSAVLYRGEVPYPMRSVDWVLA